jgi:hypothetical protein
MGPLVMGHFVMGRFVMGRFVCESYYRLSINSGCIIVLLNYTKQKQQVYNDLFRKIEFE